MEPRRGDAKYAAGRQKRIGGSSVSGRYVTTPAKAPTTRATNSTTVVRKVSNEVFFGEGITQLSVTNDADRDV